MEYRVAFERFLGITGHREETVLAAEELLTLTDEEMSLGASEQKRSMMKETENEPRGTVTAQRASGLLTSSELLCGIEQ